MRTNNLWWACIVMLSTVSAGAQVTTTGAPATNTVPMFTAISPATIGNSPISVSGGNIGIGTTNPHALLDVSGTISVGYSSFDRGFYGLSIITPDNLNLYVGSGTAAIEYSGSIKPYVDMTGYGGLSLSSQATQFGGTFGADTYTPSITTSYPTVTLFTVGVPRVVVNNLGDVGIGTTSPGATLEVNGNIKMTYNPSNPTSISFADGTVQSTAWNGTLCGGDYAETVNASGDHKKYEPGDVLVLSSDSDSDVSKSSQPYSTLVGGIYSTKPGVIGRRQTGEKRDTEIPMAMVGIVPTKVSAENGSIRRGDLLVTSSTEGYAMKGSDPSRMLGAIVGKAMGSLDSGLGVIEVLVSLQ
jgi:hypothetical protein